MPCEVTWLYPHRIMGQTYSGVLDLNLLHEVRVKAAPLIAQGQLPIHIIAEISRLTSYKLKVGDLRQAKPIQEEKKGHFVVIGANSQLQLLVNVAMMISPISIYTAADEQAAYALLASLDPSLNFSPTA